MKKILYATTNNGKLSEIRKIFSHHNISILGGGELGINFDVDETGSTLQENAKLKAESALKLVDDNTIVMADDTGLEIDALNGEPGVKVRRWRGYKMSDDEIISYCLERMQGIPFGKRGAQFHTVLAVACKGHDIKYFDGIFRGELLEKPEKDRIEGMPFFPLFYITELKMSLGNFHKLPIATQLMSPTHRELAAISALPYLLEISQVK